MCVKWNIDASDVLIVCYTIAAAELIRWWVNFQRGRESSNCHCSRLTTWQLVLLTCSVKRLTLMTVCHWSRLTVLNTLIEEVNFNNIIEADSLTEQILKRSIFKHVIEAGSLSWIDSLKRLTDNAIEAGSLDWTDRQCHCNSLCLNLVQILVLSLFWGSRESGSDSVNTELHVLVLGQTLNHWVVCSGWVLNHWVICSGVVHSVSCVSTRLIHSVSHDSSRLICSSSEFLIAAI